jgi:hypothetical protein
VRVPREDKSDDSKNNFYEELEQVFHHFPKYHVKIMLEDFSAKVGRENIFKMTIGNESLQQDNNVNGVRIVNFSTSKIYSLRARCSRTETFISTTELLVRRRLTARLNSW